MSTLKAFLSFLILIPTFGIAQQSPSIFDGRAWGTVLEHPEMKNVTVKRDIPYLSDAKATLTMDIYLPPGVKSGEKRPAVIFLNGVGDQPGAMKVKTWGIYTSWPKLVAAHGFIGISMDCDRERIQESLAGIFSFISKEGGSHNIDVEKLGVYAASANVTQSMTYLMKPEAYRGIKAAVMYYGGYPEGPYRKDLPVMFVIAEGDVHGNGYASLWGEVLKNRAPWTIKMGSGLVHAFDAFNDNDDSRKVLKETISFWKDNLDPIPTHSWPNSIGRDVLAALYGHDHNKAADLLKKYLDEHPDDHKALIQYGGSLKALNRYTEAEAALKKGIAGDPSNMDAQADLVVVYYSLNRPTDAEKVLAAAAKSGKMSKFDYANIGIGLYVLGNHKEGVKFFEKIMDMEPSGVDVYNLACGYARLNDKEKAFPALYRSVEMGFDSKQQFEQDGDLDLLRSDRRYQELLPKLK